MSDMGGDNWQLVPNPLPAPRDYVEIDLLVPHAPWFWISLQRHCVPECCGFDAYDFSHESVRFACGDSVPLGDAMIDWRDPTPGDPLALAAQLRDSARSLRSMDSNARVFARVFSETGTSAMHAELFDDLATKLETPLT